MGDSQALKEHMTPGMLLWSVFEKYTQNNVKAEEVECLMGDSLGGDLRKAQSSPHTFLPAKLTQETRAARNQSWGTLRGREEVEGNDRRQLLGCVTSDGNKPRLPWVRGTWGTRHGTGMGWGGEQVGGALTKCQCDASLRERKRKICERGGGQP